MRGFYGETDPIWVETIGIWGNEAALKGVEGILGGNNAILGRKNAIFWEKSGENLGRKECSEGYGELFGVKYVDFGDRTQAWGLGGTFWGRKTGFWEGKVRLRAEIEGFQAGKGGFWGEKVRFWGSFPSFRIDRKWGPEGAGLCVATPPP